MSNAIGSSQHRNCHEGFSTAGASSYFFFSCINLSATIHSEIKNREQEKELALTFTRILSRCTNKSFLFISRKFKLTECDQFTSNFLRKLGVRVNSPEEIPKDPYSSLRKEVRSNFFNYNSFKSVELACAWLVFYVLLQENDEGVLHDEKFFAMPAVLRSYSEVCNE